MIIIHKHNGFYNGNILFKTPYCPFVWLCWPFYAANTKLFSVNIFFFKTFTMRVFDAIPLNISLFKLKWCFNTKNNVIKYLLNLINVDLKLKIWIIPRDFSFIFWAIYGVREWLKFSKMEQLMDVHKLRRDRMHMKFFWKISKEHQRQQ